MHIHIINGPNLNLLGEREPQIYGNQNFDNYLKELRKIYPQIDFHYFQSNVEGEIINALHEHGFKSDGIILNAGGYTHTSISIADAISAITSPVIEVHISNVWKRESYRHISLIGAHCQGTISGFGMKSYQLAVEALLH
jgi:3-dehydroquinate dehydratase-2